MPASSYPLEELVPHRSPMILIDEIVDFDPVKRRIVAAVTVKREWSDSYVAIEFMAQTAAALAGEFDKLEQAERPARPGFLLGTRKLELSIDRFVVGRRYEIVATNEFADDQAASFSCEITDAGRCVAKATLNAYRPPDLAEFLKEQRC